MMIYNLTGVVNRACPGGVAGKEGGVPYIPGSLSVSKTDWSIS